MYNNRYDATNVIHLLLSNMISALIQESMTN